MHVEISLRNQQKLPYLLELLRSLDFVESVVSVQPDVPADSTSPAAPSLFEQFYGRAKSGTLVEQLDEKLNDLRTTFWRPSCLLSLCPSYGLSFLPA